MSSKPKKPRTKSKTRNSRSQNTYPGVLPGYPFPTPHWFSPQPSVGYPYQWYQPVSSIHGIHNPNVPWVPQGSNNSSPNHSPSQSFIPGASGVAEEIPGVSHVPGSPDEFTVDSMRRIYNNDDGSIEIERVKVQRRQGIYDTKPSITTLSSESKSLVPISQERRPPPRKHRKREKHGQEIFKDSGIPIQGWYPYMPYMPQPFPYAYPYGYVWPMTPQSSVSIPPHFQSPTDDSDSSASRHDSFSGPVVHSPELIQSKSRTPGTQSRLSSGTGSHVTESLGTDLAPSDSVSMRGFKRETSLERILRKSLVDSKHSEKSELNSQNAADIEKTKEWMEDMQKAFESKSGFSSELTGDRSSFTTAPSDIPTPPPKPNGFKETNMKNILTHKKSNSESNIDDEDIRNIPSLPLLENTRVSESDLPNSFHRTDREDKILKEFNDTTIKTIDNDDTIPKVPGDQSGRDSRTSTTSFHSTRQSGEDMLIETDSTDIVMPLDSSTADESVDLEDDKELHSSEDECKYKWILQSTDDLSSEGEQSAAARRTTDDVIQSWRTEVSMLRASLVVSLCRGEGLNQQDWGTFHLLIQHPLSLYMKLSLLHAQRLCSQNYDVGVALLRNALLHLTTFGENLMKPEKERMPGWKTITVDANQPWVLIKGSLEILRVMGYQVKANGTLRYKKKFSSEISVIARLTLDLLVLAEEFRLFLNGTHQNPVNITQLFASAREVKYEQAFNVRSTDENLLKEDDRRCETLGDKSLPESREQLSEKNMEDSPETSEPSDIADNRTPTSSAQITEDSTSTTEADNNANKDEPTCKELDKKIAGSDKESGSRETLTLTPIPMTEEEKQSKPEKETIDITEGNEGKKRQSKRVRGRDNPEDHVYEEIGDIKDQVDELKKRDISSQSPPPLPPKTKGSQADDIYPQVDWSLSSSSQYSTLHTDSISKRKKRKAPMPPSFSTESQYETLPKESDDNKDLQNTDSVKTKDVCTSKNPFYEERIKPAGYVGKNPFYEDLDTNQQAGRKSLITLDENPFESTNQADINSQISDSKDDDIVKSHLSASVDDVSEASSTFSFPAGVRPERKKKRKVVKTPPIVIDKSENETTENNEKKLSTTKKRDKTIIVKFKTTENKITKEKNDERELQRDSQVVVPSNESTERRKESISQNKVKKDVIIQKISITYDISLDESKDKLSQSSKSNPMCKKEISSIKGEKDPTKQENITQSNDTQQISTEIKHKIVDHDHLKNILKNIPNTEENSDVEKKTEIDSPPIPPPKPALRLIDDIPYIDCNDVKSYRQNYAGSERQQPPHYGIAELKPAEIISSSISDKADGKAPSFLKLSSVVPFIDETELSTEANPSILIPPSPPPIHPPSPPQLSLESLPFIDSEDQEISDPVKTDEIKLVSLLDFVKTDHEKIDPKEKCENQLMLQTSDSSSLSNDNGSKNLEKMVPGVKMFQVPPSPPSSPPPTPPLSLLASQENKSELTSESVHKGIDSFLAIKTDKESNIDKTDKSDKVENNQQHEPDNKTAKVDYFKTDPEVIKEKLTNNEAKLNIDNKLENSKIQGNNDPNHETILTKKEQTIHTTEKNDCFLEEKKNNRENKVNEISEDRNGELIDDECDTDHKSMMLFGSEKIQKGKHSESQDHEYELSGPLEVNTEERYEIPAALGCDTSDKKTPSTSKETSLITSENKNDDSHPKRPPRSQIVGKPPPLPPKPQRLSPPALPPKTESFKSQKSSSTPSFHPSSLPSTLTKPYNGKVNSGKKVQPSPLAIPEMYKSSPDNLGKTSSSASKDMVTSQKRGIIRTSSNETAKALPKSQNPSSECASLPASPKVQKMGFKSQIKKDKQKSWPFLLCDCVHPTNSNDDIKYVIK